MNFTRITPTDLHALKTLRGSSEYKRLFESAFSAHCGDRRRKVDEAEREEARQRENEAVCLQAFLRADEALKAARREVGKLQAEHALAASACFGASASISQVRAVLERELVATAHPDIQEILWLVLDLEDKCRLTVRTQIGSYERNILGRAIPSVWTNSAEVTRDMEKRHAIAVGLRRLQTAAYPETLIERLRGYYKQAADIAAAREVRLLKIETVSGVEGERDAA